MHHSPKPGRVYLCRVEADDLAGGRVTCWLAGSTVAVWYWGEVLYREHTKNERHPDLTRRAISYPDGPVLSDDGEEIDLDDLPFG
jgi:hypothetical protein